jgi:hypothetical protein
MMMPWGAFKGKPIESIPSGYLKWLAENCEDNDICEEADEEFRRRTDDNEHFWD